MTDLPPPPPNSYGGAPRPLPGPPPVSPKSPWWRAWWVVGVLGLIIGLAIGAAAGSGGKSKTSAKSTVTVTAGATTADISSAAPPADTDVATEVPTDDESSQPTLDPSDFTITVKIRRKACFGSAGCNVTYEIDPQYNGIEDLDSGSWDVTYQVTGDEDGPQINTFTIENGTASYPKEETLSTSTTVVKIRAKVTDVEPE